MKLAVSLLLSAAVVLGGSALVTRRAAARAAEAEAAYPPEGAFLIVEGRRVHYVEMGSGPDLVLIHGASGNTRDFTFAFAERMAARYRVIVFDRPGMGYSDHADPAYAAAFAARVESPADQADILVAAAAQLGALRPLVLGHSYGNTVALAWALDHPDRIAGVINLGGVAMPWPGDLGWLYRVNGTAVGGALFPPLIAAFYSESYVESVIEEIFDPNAAPDGYGNAVGASLSVRTATIRANARQVNTLRPYVVEMSARYGELTLPIEIVHGGADTIVPPEIHSIPFSDLVPSANLTMVEGLGHMPQHNATEVVEAAIDRAAVRAGLR
jgi:pimeloyl-ACP methyl ester carboxylesterase